MDPLDDRDVDPDLEGLDAEALIQRALDLVSSAKAMPLSASVLVSRDELTHLLTLALSRLPEELREARWLLKEREAFMAEREREAQALMDEVRAQAERMVARTDIVRQANKVAQKILDDANEEARRLRHETEDFCDQRLAGMEIVLDRTIKTVRSGRQKLQAISAPPERSRPSEPEPEDGSDAERFFDQDRA
jgi:hypothetical protein